ncbi:unnamed protein product [Laminaria digitata]
MKFGKKIRTELSPELLRGTVNYKALKQIAKRLAGRAGVRGQHQHHHHLHQQQQQQQQHQLQQQQLHPHRHHHHQGHEQGAQEFFSRLEVENEKVANFYQAREARCFLALETTRGALFGLTRRASKERLCQASSEHRPQAGAGFGQAPNAPSPALTAGGGGGSGQERDAAGELEGKFLEAKASATMLLSESRDLVKFVDVNMHAFR